MAKGTFYHSFCCWQQIGFAYCLENSTHTQNLANLQNFTNRLMSSDTFGLTSNLNFTFWELPNCNKRNFNTFSFFCKFYLEWNFRLSKRWPKKTKTKKSIKPNCLTASGYIVGWVLSAKLQRNNKNFKCKVVENIWMELEYQMDINNEKNKKIEQHKWLEYEQTMIEWWQREVFVT